MIKRSYAKRHSGREGYGIYGLLVVFGIEKGLYNFIIFGPEDEVTGPELKVSSTLTSSISLKDVSLIIVYN